MIETHAHIYLEQFESDLTRVIDRSRDSGIEQIMMPNVDRTTIDAMLEVELKNQGYCSAMMGLHPCSVNKNFDQELYIVEEWLNRRPFIAVGEIGIDLYWDTSTFKYQKEAFSIQTGFAVERNLPIAIHCRESIDQTLDILEGLAMDNARGVFHCFTGSPEQAERAIALGFYLGIGGVVTFKNSGLDQTLTKVSLDHVVIETDSPYLSPAPHRGKRNEPSYLTLIASKLAEVYNKDIKDIDKITSENALRLFKADHEV